MKKLLVTLLALVAASSIHAVYTSKTAMTKLPPITAVPADEEMGIEGFVTVPVDNG